jgi:hypothetical protein
MADKTYVEISAFTIASDVDSKYKTKAVASMAKVAEAAVKASSKLTLDKPEPKGAKGWFVFGNLDSVGADKAGKKFEAKVSITISTWPAKSMKSFAKGSGGFTIASADEKVSPSDVDQVITAAVKDAMKSGVPYMEKTKPE